MMVTSLAPETSERVFTLNSEMQIGLDSTAHPQTGWEANAEHMRVDRVRWALRATGYRELRKLAIEIDGGSVKLDGRVSSYHLKQLAQSAVKHVPGVAFIVNAVVVANGR